MKKYSTLLVLLHLIFTIINSRVNEIFIQPAGVVGDEKHTLLNKKNRAINRSSIHVSKRSSSRVMLSNKP